MDVNISRISHIYSSFAELERAADCRETSEEILVAIAEIASSAREAERIWEEGSDEIAEIVISRAWELADEDDERLFWGDTTIYRDNG